MRTALISTLFNEARNLPQWWRAIVAQTVRPDEIVIVDGGSKDGTWEMLQDLARESPVPVRLKQQRCNIAEGRNIAIGMTGADIIASTDAGSFPVPEWFGELTGPLLADPTLDVVGGRSVNRVANDFQGKVVRFQQEPPEPARPDQVYPSSRNIAFRRKAWLAVGGYPEWLTLTGEDALFNYNLHRVGARFQYSRNAVVAWSMREDAAAYFKMLRSYAYGAAEARLFGRKFVVSAVITLVPPLLLLSRHRAAGFWFRYRKYLSNTAGWLAGRLWGHKSPRGWTRIEGVLLSPETRQTLALGSNR